MSRLYFIYMYNECFMRMYMKAANDILPEDFSKYTKLYHIAKKHEALKHDLWFKLNKDQRDMVLDFDHFI